MEQTTLFNDPPKEKDHIYIPHNVPSSKNSKQLAFNKKTQRTFITESKVSKQYRKDTKMYWIANRSAFLKMIRNKAKPYILEFYFVRRDRRKFDWQNMVQLPLDLMQEYDWIEDDDIHNVLPVPPLPPRQSHEVNKEKCGFVLRVLGKDIVNKKSDIEF